MSDADSYTVHSPPESSPYSPPEDGSLGRQRAVAAIRPMDPSSFLARISNPITDKTSSIISGGVALAGNGRHRRGTVWEAQRVAPQEDCQFPPRVSWR